MTNLKTHAPVHKNEAKEHGKHKNVLKPMRLCTKTKQKGARTRAPRGYSHPGGPAIRITVCMRPRSFASPARTARTTRTKRKRRRNEADLPVTGGGQAGLTPLNLRLLPDPSQVDTGSIQRKTKIPQTSQNAPEMNTDRPWIHH